MQLKLLASIIVITSALLSTANAQAKLLESRMETFQVKTIKGKETLRPAHEATPGQILEYKVTYTSHADKPLSIQYVSVPIPDDTQYVAGSAKTAINSTFQVSIDHGKIWEKEPVIRQHKDKNGELKEVIISPTEYTNLRWKEQNPIKPEAEQLFHYRVKIQ